MCRKKKEQRHDWRPLLLILPVDMNFLDQDVGPREELRPGGPSLGGDPDTTDGVFGLLKAALGTQVRGTEEMACRVE